MLAEVLDALGLEKVDLVANDSGGAIAQIFAAHHPERLTSLVLTNCDVHDGWPPPQVLPIMERARMGTLAPIFQPMLVQALIGSLNPMAQGKFKLFENPSSLHWLGTDRYGRDSPLPASQLQLSCSNNFTIAGAESACRRLESLR